MTGRLSLLVLKQGGRGFWVDSGGEGRQGRKERRAGVTWSVTNWAGVAENPWNMSYHVSRKSSGNFSSYLANLIDEQSFESCGGEEELFCCAFFIFV